MENNVKNEVLEVINNIPTNASPIEKVRWVYVKLGEIFSFDMKTPDYRNRIDLNSDYINKYQTCVQISYFLNEILNKIDPNIKCRVIERKIQDHYYEQEHLANVITYNNNGENEEYMLDLTLDLFRIHFNLKTKEFGFNGHPDLNLYIMPQVDNEIMDKKLGLYENGYTDDKIKEVQEELSFIDFSNVSFEDEIDYRLTKAKAFFNNNSTYSESNQFLYNTIIDHFLKCEVIRSVIRNDNEMMYVYIFKRNKDVVFYIYDEENNFYKTTKEDIAYLLNHGWVNRKELLIDFLESQYGMII